MDAIDWLAIVIILLVLVVIIQALTLAHLLHPHDPTPVRIKILFRRKKMADIVEGGTLPFTVVGINKRGSQVPITGVTVTAVDGAATVADDGTGGVFTAADPGAASVTATAQGFTDTAAITVTADPTPVGIKVVL